MPTRSLRNGTATLRNNSPRPPPTLRPPAPSFAGMSRRLLVPVRSARRSPADGALRAGGGLDLAGSRFGDHALPQRRRPVRGGPAPRHRHRGRRRDAGGGCDRRRGALRRHRGVVGHHREHPDLRRPVRHVLPAPLVDRRAHGRSRVRRRPRRRRRHDRPALGGRAAPPLRRARRRHPPRLSRPNGLPATAALAGGASRTGPGAGARAGAHARYPTPGARPSADRSSGAPTSRRARALAPAAPIAPRRPGPRPLAAPSAEPNRLPRRRSSPRPRPRQGAERGAAPAGPPGPARSPRATNSHSRARPRLGPRLRRPASCRRCARSLGGRSLCHPTRPRPDRRRLSSPWWGGGRE